MMSSTKKIFYAALGAGDLAMEKARKAQSMFDFDWAKARSEVPRSISEARTGLEKTATQAVRELRGRYSGLIKRGEKTFKGIKGAVATKRAVAQTKTARTQTKAAATSVRKAADATIESVKQAAEKVG